MKACLHAYQVAEKLRTDERVVVMERTNLRHLRREHLPERPSLATLDLSFISLLKVPPGEVCTPNELSWIAWS